MTIIKNTQAIRYHTLSAVDKEVGELIVRSAEALRQSLQRKSLVIKPSLMVLEAYCDITRQRITMDTLRSPAIEQILHGFTKTLAGETLIRLPNRESLKYCRVLYQVLNCARIEHPDLHPLTWHSTEFKQDPLVCAAINSSATDFQRWYWQGWTIERPRSPTVYLRLAQLIEPYGRDFVQSVYHKLEQYFRNRTGTFHSEWNYMFDYMAQHHSSYRLSTLRTEEGVKTFMEQFTLSYFHEAMRTGRDAQSQIKNWNRFVNSLEECLCNSIIWASLSSSIRRPPPSTKHGSQTKVKESEEGMLIQEKLLTNIPLHVTDAQAVEILFFHIKQDVAVVRHWALAQAADMKSRHARRTELAKRGSPITEFQGRGIYKNYTLEDICATLEEGEFHVPISFLCKVYRNITGQKCSATELAYAFGLPITESLFPLQCLLVLEHPVITTEFLKHIELYNQQGQLVGFDEEKRLLIGHKNRKQPDVREQIIQLNDLSLDIVKDIINLTSIGRQTLKNQKNDDWRFLFITSGRAVKPFQVATVTIWNDHTFRNKNGLRARLLEQFRPHSDRSDAALIELIKKVRLTKIRSSRAVEIFLESKSSEQMSKALGHEHYYADLLSHYLPEAILAFIKSRWIRIFQKAMICEAMKDSPNLLSVTKFNSIDELDAFLENHRIREIPAEASDPERKSQNQEIHTSEAVLSIGTPFLISLLSLEAAVLEAKNRVRVCGKAEYWASFADKIRTEIMSGTKRVLKKHLETSLEFVDPKAMEGLIYAKGHRD